MNGYVVDTDQASLEQFGYEYEGPLEIAQEAFSPWIVTGT